MQSKPLVLLLSRHSNRSFIFNPWPQTRGGQGRNTKISCLPSPESAASPPHHFLHYPHQTRGAPSGRRGHPAPVQFIKSIISDSRSVTATPQPLQPFFCRRPNSPWSGTPRVPRTRRSPRLPPRPRGPRFAPPARRAVRRPRVPSGPRTLLPVFDRVVGGWTCMVRESTRQCNVLKRASAPHTCLVGPHLLDAAAREEKVERRHLG